MKNPVLFASMLLVALLTTTIQLKAAPVGTAFTYQGRLNAGSQPAGGIYDLRFTLYDSVANGSAVGNSLTNSATGVTNGLFTVTLDFGPAVFDGNARWLDISVRTNGAGAFTTLTPRQALTPAPYATMAGTASNLLGTLPATKISGVMANNQLANNSVTVAAGFGLTGGGTVPLGGSTTLNNAGVISIIGNPDISATTVNGAVTLGDTSTSTNVADRMVKRDAAGSFSAGSITLSSNLYLPAATTGGGIVYSGGSPFIYANGSGAMNFFAGFGAGNLTISGNYNTGVGYAALDANTTGGNNTACGLGALGSNTTGGENTASGVNALAYNVGGSQNVADGAAALYRNTNGAANIASGYFALGFNRSGSANTAVGYYALNQNTTGSNNIALGYQAGYYLTTGSSNIDIGHPGLASDTNIIRIGSSQTQTFIAGQIYGNAAGLTNLNAASLTGLLPGLSIDDGGTAAYEEFLGPATSMSAAAPLPFSSLSLVSSNNGAAPSFTFSLNGEPFGAVVGFVGHEAISEPYEFVVEVIASSSAVNPDEQLGHSGVLTFARNGRSTTFAGIVAGCSVSSYDGAKSRYTFRLESSLVNLAHSSGYHINQDLSVPSLAVKLYQEVAGTNLSQSLTGAYGSHESLTQFGETDLNFFSRILEEEGVFYFFVPSGAPPTLILGDSSSAYLPAANSPFRYYGDTAASIPPGAEFIRTFQKSVHQSTSKSTLNSYNFKTPNVSLLESVSGVLGGVGENYEFENYTTQGDGKLLARFRQEHLEAERMTMAGSSTAPDLRPGYTFELADQTASGVGGAYVVTGVRHAAFRRMTNGVASLYYGNQFEVIPASMNYRPGLKTPKPVAQASTAVITGPAGEEIHTDQYGRVKVKFRWDRDGANDDTSSAWVQVASPWAGAAWGMLFIPRVGQEVLVEYANGDPDQPLVTGSLYNGDHVTPYSLPANKTQSGIKTRSSKGGVPGNENEIRFEDKLGSEEIYINAEKDLNIKAGHDLTISTAGHLTISALGVSANATVSASSFQGSGSGLTDLPANSITGALSDASLSANVALLNNSQTFTGCKTFASPVQFFADGYLNDMDVYLRNDTFHGLGWYGVTKLFAGTSVNGPVLYGFSGGALGYKNFTTTNLALTWNDSGNVGIGTSSPTHVLHINSTSTTNTVRLTGPGVNGAGAKINFGDAEYVYLYEVSDDILRVQATRLGIDRTPTANRFELEGEASKTTAGSWLANSDARIKTEIATITNALETLDRVRPVSFRYTEAYRAAHPTIEDRTYVNVLAQEFRDVFPNAVKGSGEHLADGSEILQVDTYPLTIYSAAAIRDLKQELDSKEAQIQALERRLEILEQRLSKSSGQTQ